MNNKYDQQIDVKIQCFHVNDLKIRLNGVFKLILLNDKKFLCRKMIIILHIPAMNSI